MISLLIMMKSLILFLLMVARYILVVQIIMSWLIAFNVINTHNDYVRSIWIALDKLTEPLYRPIRRVMPDLGALDLSPMVILLLIVMLEGIIVPGIFGALIQSVA